MKVLSFFLATALSLPVSSISFIVKMFSKKQCPRLWSAEWESGMEKVFSNVIIGTAFPLEGGARCYPTINKIECDPPLDQVAGEYPYQVMSDYENRKFNLELSTFVS
jgi:hypothetical protein